MEAMQLISPMDAIGFLSEPGPFSLEVRSVMCCYSEEKVIEQSTKYRCQSNFNAYAKGV